MTKSELLNNRAVLYRLLSHVLPGFHHCFIVLQGKYEEAMQSVERSLDIREKARGPDHPDVADSLQNRASVLEYLVSAIVLFLGLAFGTS